MKAVFNLISCVALLTLPFLVGGCENNEDSLLPPRHFVANMEIDGLKRTYIVNLPPQYYEDETNLYPLVIGLHGTGGNASQFENHYGFSIKADEAGFVAVYPEGVARNGPYRIRTWNAGTCCDFAMQNNINDVAFISRLIDEMTGQYHIDKKRVYVTGMSNGGMLAYRLAAELPGKIAAIAPVSSTMVYHPSTGQSRPVPILHLHSYQDRIVPYAGGSDQLGYYFPPVDSVLRVWAQRNNCTPEPTVLVSDGQYTQMQWTNAQGNVMIMHYVTQDGSHAWPMALYARPRNPASQAINANELIWDFFSQYKLE